MKKMKRSQVLNVGKKASPSFISLPTEHSKEDMLKIARSHLPAGDVRSLKLLSNYALGSEKKQASGIVEALESARYRTDQNGRNEVTFADIEAALIHDHKFLNPAPADDVRWAGSAWSGVRPEDFRKSDARHAVIALCLEKQAEWRVSTDC